MLFITFQRYVLNVNRRFNQKTVRHDTQNKFALQAKKFTDIIATRLGLSVSEHRRIPQSTEMTEEELASFQRFADWVDGQLNEKMVRQSAITAKEAKQRIHSLLDGIRDAGLGEVACTVFLRGFAEYDAHIRNPPHNLGLFDLPEDDEIPVEHDFFLAHLEDEVVSLIRKARS